MTTAIKWHAVVFDEAHKLKDPKSQTYAAAMRLGTKLRYGLSGTAMQVRTVTRHPCIKSCIWWLRRVLLSLLGSLSAEPLCCYARVSGSDAGMRSDDVTASLPPVACARAAVPSHGVPQHSWHASKVSNRTEVLQNDYGELHALLDLMVPKCLGASLVHNAYYMQSAFFMSVGCICQGAVLQSSGKVLHLAWRHRPVSAITADEPRLS